MRRKSHPRLGAVSSLLSVEPKALCKSMSQLLIDLSIVGVSVCYSVGISVFKSVFHLANHLVVHSSKTCASLFYSDDGKTLVKSFVLFMPACRVNSFSNSWFLVSSQTVITPQMCKRRNHASSRMTDLTVRSKAHRPNQRALSKPVPALHFTSTHENQMTTPSLSKSQTQKFLNHSPILTSCQTQKATIQKVYHFLLPQCLSQLPPFYHIKKLPQTNTNPSASLSLDKFYLPILVCLCLNHYLTLILVSFNVDRYLPLYT